MNKYETVFIADPDLQDQTRKDLFDKVKNIIAGEKGILVDLDEWGNKKLAYEIHKKNRGHYVCITYGGTGELVKELERNFRITDDVMKFMTILLTKDVDPAVLEEEALQASQVQKSTPVADDSDTDSNDGSDTNSDEDSEKDEDDEGQDEEDDTTLDEDN